MSGTLVTERPTRRTPSGGGAPARRAVIRWAMRLLRREWRQQLLILALVTVAVARAMVGERRLLLADEPSGALDSVNAQAVMRMLHEACKDAGMTAVVVTHDAQLASWADRVVFLRDGRITDQTAPAPGPESLLTPEQYQ